MTTDVETILLVFVALVTGGVVLGVVGALALITLAALAQAKIDIWKEEIGWED